MRPRLFFILALGTLALGVSNALATQIKLVASPIIEFTDVPPYGSSDDLKGRVGNVSPADYKVAVYIFVEGAGWWTKPTFAQPLTPIQVDSTWECHITTGGSDIYATKICAFLLPDGVDPPLVDGDSALPETLYTISVAYVCTTRTPTVISFSGYEWWVKASVTPVGPGPNYFSDSTDNVWVDEWDQLHLKITKRNGKWYCGEVYLPYHNSIGYGKYIFYVIGRIGQLDSNVVLGLFTWDTSPEEFHREIDIEFSRWGEETDTNAQYVVQPWEQSGRHRWIMPPSIDSSTHSFEWKPDSVYFLSLKGHQSVPPFDSIIHSWVYTGPNIPTHGNENARINLWLYNHIAPADTTGVEVIIKKFEIDTEEIAVITPNGGENWCVDSTDTITWNSSNIDSVMIEYTTDGGANWDTIAASTPAAPGTYAWTVPNIPSESCLVRICDAADNDPCDESDTFFTIEVCECPDLPLHSGWQWVSTNVDPDPCEMESIFVDCWGDLDIIIACDGSFCIPGIGCWIDCWNVLEMYKLHMSDACTIQVCGSKVPTDTPIPLLAGWGCIAYFPECPLEPETALVSIWDCLDIVKNDDGEFCIPGIGCWIECMEPNEGYKVHLDSACTLIYPTSCPPCPPPFAKTNSFPGFAKTSHFSYLGNTGESYSIVVNSAELSEKHLEVGDEIGVFTPSGLCVGGGVWQGGILGIAAWQDDDRTEAVDGFQVSEQIVFKLWDKSEGEEIDLVVSNSTSDVRFGDGPYAIVSLKTEIGLSLLPSAFSLSQNYPNPFNPMCEIQYALPTDCQVRLSVYNILGQKVRVLVDEYQEAGYKSAKWDGRNDQGQEVTSGVYFYRIEAGDFVQSKKMVLMK